MRTRILIIAGIAVAGYVIGTRANRPVQTPRESLRHQLERLWSDPKTRRRRAKRIAKLRKDGERTAERLVRAARERAKDLGR